MNYRIAFARTDELGTVEFSRDVETRTESQAISVTVRDLMAKHPDDWHKYKMARIDVIERVTA